MSGTTTEEFDPLDLSDRLFSGELSTHDRHPVARLTNLLAEVADRTAWVESLANVTVFSTDDGLCVVDTGGLYVAPVVHERVRDWTHDRFDTAIYTHGHVDHVMGTEVFEAWNEAEGQPRGRVVGHEAVGGRFDRYLLTLGYNSAINRRQFQAELDWPSSYRYPDTTYRDRLDVTVGGERFELHHARGETDDHTWVWAPGRRVLCTGDLFIWAVPNAGNPQKVQRYAGEWAVALREMAALGAELLLPGHGLPIAGADRVRGVLDDTATLLESLERQTLEMMNAGATLDDIIHSVAAPASLAGRPYLQPVYDEPEFIVRNIWRLYGGWYDGDPSHLKPASDAALASEVAALCGGAETLARRAAELSEAGDDRLACHLVEPAGRRRADRRRGARAPAATSTPVASSGRRPPWPRACSTRRPPTPSGPSSADPSRSLDLWTGSGTAEVQRSSVVVVDEPAWGMMGA
ncbi:MAG: alkyl sulfatase dimerization domain-containing protein [Acidimicrobiia bacterium]|nr:alkyl sulfatase dimerization domain-containing protein [Acidimicrobiia bacterium]